MHSSEEVENFLQFRYIPPPSLLIQDRYGMEFRETAPLYIDRCIVPTL
jgi:hypothetical protein